MSVESHTIFAYGSNMLTQRMTARAPKAAVIGIGFIAARRLAFHKRSHDGSAKANMVVSDCPHDQVWGVLYHITGSERRKLDKYEFVGTGYDVVSVVVTQPAGRTRPALCYIARREAVDTTLRPYDWYHALVLHGARQHRLPADYIAAFLESTAVVIDSDQDRRYQHLRMLDHPRT